MPLNCLYDIFDIFISVDIIMHVYTQFFFIYIYDDFYDEAQNKKIKFKIENNFFSTRWR